MKAAFLPLYKQSVKWSWRKNGNKINLNLRNHKLTEPSRCLGGSVDGTRNSRSWGSKFEPHAGYIEFP